MPARRQLAAIMFTDIVGYSAMMNTDEEHGFIVANRYRQVLEQEVKDHGGEIIHHYGDGSLSIFPSAVDAVSCAREIQSALKEAPLVPLRIGVHVGDIVSNGNDIFGDGVNIASRVESMGIPGAILLTERVMYDLRSHPEYKMTSLGLFRFKNIEEPIEVFALANQGLSVPTLEEMQGKGRAVEDKPSSLLSKYGRIIGAIALLMGIAISSILLFPQGSSKAFFEEKIAVIPFDNNTNDTTLAVIGKIASHWITKGLQETSDAKVVSFQSVNFNKERISKAQMGLSGFSTLTGAGAIIEGQYLLENDSLIFQSWVRRLSDGQITHTFKDLKCEKATPLAGIRKLESAIKGYWVSKSEGYLTAPNFEAYSNYIKAKDYWAEDDEKVNFFLSKAIEEDSAFIDAYFLMAQYHSNNGEYEEEAKWIDLIKKRFTVLSERQLNLLYCYEAELAGKPRLALQYLLKEYAYDPKDLFSNIAMAISVLEYFNDPQSTLEILEEIPIDQLDYEQCAYCHYRLTMALKAHMKSGNINEVGELVELLPERHDNFITYGIQSQAYAFLRDTQRLNKLLALVSSDPLLEPNLIGLYFTAVRSFALLGEEELQYYYGERALALLDEQHYLNASLNYLTGNYEKALELYKDLREEYPNYLPALIGIGNCYARLGLVDKALEIINTLDEKKTNYQFGQIAYHQGVIYYLSGKRGPALKKLETALLEGATFLETTFDGDPDLLSLRGDPEYEKLIHPELDLSILDE